MTKYRVKCLTKNLLTFIESDGVPTECPVDNCGSFDYEVEQ